MTKEPQIELCKNCETKIPLNSSFCPNCGQETKNKKIGLKDLVSDLFTNFLLFDFKIFKSLGALLLPGKLTQDYFSGK